MHLHVVTVFTKVNLKFNNYLAILTIKQRTRSPFLMQESFSMITVQYLDVEIY